MKNNKYKKVPPYNDKFSFQKFTHVLKESIPFISIIFIFAFIAGYLYIRYTPPLYQAYSIIQINKDETTQKILSLDNEIVNNKETDLPHVIEQLRSKEFLKRVFDKLPLKIGYFREGTFLREEIYKATPFKVKIKNFNLYNQPIYIDFPSKNEAVIKYTINNQTITKKIKTGEWQNVGDFNIKITITNYKSILENYNNIKSNNYLFIVYDDKTLFNTNYQKLQISIENQLAKTIKIQFSDNNANKVADIVNTIAEEFLKYDVENKKLSTKRILEFIEKQSAIVYEKLNYLDRKLKKYDKSFGLNSISGSTTNYIDKVNELEDKKMDLQYELSTLQTVKNLLTKQKEINIYQIVGLISGLDIEQSFIAALNNLQQYIEKRENLLNELQPDNLRIKRLNEKIQKQKLLFLTMLNSISKRLNDEIEKINSKIKDYQIKMNVTHSDAVEKTRLERLYKVNEEYYNNLLAKKTEYLIYQAGYVSNNTILEKASVPDSPILPKKFIVFLTIFIFAFVVSITFLIIKYLFYNNIILTSDITDYTDVPIAGLIPNIKTNSEISKLIINPKSSSTITEAFRQLRTNLEFLGLSEENKLIAITSTVSGEGKTFVSINLAGIIAGLEKKVVLLDLDLRKPKLHIGFGVKKDKGISTILVGKHTLDECIYNNMEGGFDFIPAGKEPPNPAELISKHTMDEMLDKLKLKYDVIIMDTPPVGLVIDAFSIYKKANIQLYVLRQNYSHKTFINNINHLKYDLNLQNIAIVFNNIKITRNGYSYGYGYTYNYGYSYQKENTPKIKRKKRFFNK